MLREQPYGCLFLELPPGERKHKATGDCTKANSVPAWGGLSSILGWRSALYPAFVPNHAPTARTLTRRLPVTRPETNQHLWNSKSMTAKGRHASFWHFDRIRLVEQTLASHRW